MHVLPGLEYVARDIPSATAYPASDLALLQTSGNPALDEVEQLRPGTPRAGSISMPTTSSWAMGHPGNVLTDTVTYALVLERHALVSGGIVCEDSCAIGGGIGNKLL